MKIRKEKIHFWKKIIILKKLINYQKMLINFMLMNLIQTIIFTAQEVSLVNILYKKNMNKINMIKI